MNFSQSTIFSIAASFGILFINLFINIIESRVLGPQEIGRFQVYITTQTFAATICALGIGQACIYYINALKMDERVVLSTSIKFSLLLSLFAGCVVLLIILFNRGYFGEDSIFCISIFCLGTSVTIINNIFTPVLLTRMEVVRNQIVRYSTRVITLLALLTVLLMKIKLSVGFVIALSGFTSLFATILLYSYFHDRFSLRNKMDFLLLRKILLWGIKLSGNNIASITLTSIPIYFLTWFSLNNGVLNVGYYSRAYSLLVIGTVIASSIGPLLYSKWSGTSEEDMANQVRRLSMLYILVNVAIIMGLVLSAPLLIKLLYGKEYLASISILQVLAFTLIGNGVKEICYGILSSRGAPLLILKNLLIGIVISTIANYFAITNYGVLGCAVVTVAISIVTALLLMHDVTRVSSIKYTDFFVIPSRTEVNTIVKSLINRK